jgi:hypothetical protein
VVQFVEGEEDLYVEALRIECDKELGGSRGSAINMCNNPATLGRTKSWSSMMP